MVFLLLHTCVKPGGFWTGSYLRVGSGGFWWGSYLRGLGGGAGLDVLFGCAWLGVPGSVCVARCWFVARGIVKVGRVVVKGKFRFLREFGCWPLLPTQHPGPIPPNYPRRRT